MDTPNRPLPTLLEMGDTEALYPAIYHSARKIFREKCFAFSMAIQFTDSELDNLLALSKAFDAGKYSEDILA